MDTNSVVEKACNLPVSFYSGSKTMVELIVESGIDKNLSALTVLNVNSYISNHMELIEQWLRWSENKRSASGWYFSCQPEKCTVAFHPKGEVLSFPQSDTACAEFIMREIQHMCSVRKINSKE